MKTCGIIAEYNPFHNGHKHQIDTVRNLYGTDFVIAVMSGDFVQRGTPAIFSKHVRTEMALKAGADLVLELPVSLATASAELFASGGVRILDALGVTDLLCFGSEEGDTAPLRELASILAWEPRSYREALRAELSQGSPFPAARSRALLSYLENQCTVFPSLSKKSRTELEALLASPNNLLGIEYCKAILRINSAMEPVTLSRTGASYHAIEVQANEAPSATFLRAQLGANDPITTAQSLKKLASFVPESVLPVYETALSQNALLTESAFDVLLGYRLLGETRESLVRYMDLSPALSDRILNQRNRYTDFSSFVQLLKTKELTYTRIQRGLLHLLLNISPVASDYVPPYVRVLGFRKESSMLLKELRNKSRIPLISKASQLKELHSPEVDEAVRRNLFAAGVYEQLLCRKTKQAFRHEYEKPVVIL